MIEIQHTGMTTNVNVGREVSESFSVTNGIKQGCVLAPKLFSIFLSAMLDDAFRDIRDGIYIQSTQSADLFNVANFRVKTDQDYSDTNVRAAINIKKTEVMYEPNSTRTREEDIIVDGKKLNSVVEFTYLGNTISINKCIDDEIQRRMANCSASFV